MHNRGVDHGRPAATGRKARLAHRVGRASTCGLRVAPAAVLALLTAGCAPGSVNWSGEQNGGRAPGNDLTTAGGALHCSLAAEMSNDAVERFLESKGYAVTWRLDGPPVAAAPPDEALLVEAAVEPDRPGEAKLLAFTTDGEFSAQAEGLRQGFVDRVQTNCPR